MPDIVLIHSPLVGPSSLHPTADELSTRGVGAWVPSPLKEGTMPKWRDWGDALVDHLPDLDHPVVVGHSMGGLLAAQLASRLAASAFICLDARMPHDAGLTPTVEPSFHDFVKSLPVENGVLPPWHDWWPIDVFEGTNAAPELQAAVKADIPRLRLDWFDDAFDMPDWSRVKRAFIRTSHAFIDDARQAEQRGWTVVKLRGTHLHPAIEPKETADAILDCCRSMGI